jgi:hypothetical protein
MYSIFSSLCKKNEGKRNTLSVDKETKLFSISISQQHARNYSQQQNVGHLQMELAVHCHNTSGSE